MVFLFLSLNIHAKYETEQISLIVTTIASYYQFPSTFSVGLFTFMFWTPPPLSYNGINQIHKRVKSWTYAPQIYAKNCNGCQIRTHAIGKRRGSGEVRTRDLLRVKQT